MRFSANLSTLWPELPFLERFGAAARAGFGAVEFWWPDDDPEEIDSAVRDAGVAVALFNVDAGDMPAGDRGLLADPARDARFRASVPAALELATRLACTRLNLLAGNVVNGSSRDDQLATARESFRWAAERAADAGVTVLLEPLNPHDAPRYLVHTTADALAFLDAVARPNTALQYDIYHAQRAEGNVVGSLRAALRRVGHIQLADSPDRGEPGTGELRFPYILAELERQGYTGWVGLEYNPSTTTTEESLAWLPREMRSAAGGRADRLGP